MMLIRDLLNMRDGPTSSPSERHFAREYLLIHSAGALAQKHWERTVVLRARTRECPDDNQHQRCCEIHAVAVLLPMAILGRCPECSNVR